MATFTEIRERYERYIKDCRELQENAGAFDGFLGLGHDPKKDSCHKLFYQDVGAMVDEMIASEPSAEETAETTDYLLKAEICYQQEKLAVWMCAAAQGHALKLLPMLSREQAAELFAWYDQNYPRRKRLPVQDQIYKALKKQCRK